MLEEVLWREGCLVEASEDEEPFLNRFSGWEPGQTPEVG